MSILRTSYAVLAKIAWPMALLSVATVLVVICFGGTHNEDYKEQWEHGWPYVFLRRYCDGESGRFRFQDGAESFQGFALFLDALVFVGILVALIFGPRWPSRHAPERRRLSVSLSTFLRGIIGGLLAVVCFGGTQIDWAGTLFGLGQTWEHGWPFVFLYRSGFMESTRFSFWEEPTEFRRWTLLLDVLVFAGLLGLVIVVPRWLNRRPATEGRVAFSLSSLFAVLTLACVLLGSIGYALASSRTERATMAKLKEQGHTVTIQYIGPVWLARLLGETDPYQESLLHGCKSIRVRKWANAEELRLLSQQIQLLQNLEQLDFGAGSYQDDDLKLLIRSIRTSRVEHVLVNNTEISGAVFADSKMWPKLT